MPPTVSRGERRGKAMGVVKPVAAAGQPGAVRGKKNRPPGCGGRFATRRSGPLGVLALLGAAFRLALRAARGGGFATGAGGAAFLGGAGGEHQGSGDKSEREETGHDEDDVVMVAKCGLLAVLNRSRRRGRRGLGSTGDKGGHGGHGEQGKDGGFHDDVVFSLLGGYPGDSGDLMARLKGFWFFAMGQMRGCGEWCSLQQSLEIRRQTA